MILRDRAGSTAPLWPRGDRFPPPFDLRPLHVTSGREASLYLHFGTGDNQNRSINVIRATRSMPAHVFGASGTDSTKSMVIRILYVAGAEIACGCTEAGAALPDTHWGTLDRVNAARYRIEVFVFGCRVSGGLRTCLTT